mgnify:CR=1 FL=1
MEYRAPSGIKLFSFFNSWLDSWMARQQKQPKSFHADQLTSHPASSTEPVTLSTFFRSPLIPQYSVLIHSHLLPRSDTPLPGYRIQTSRPPQTAHSPQSTSSHSLIGSKLLRGSLQTGQHQRWGSSSNSVPGGILQSGSPSAGSYR